VYDILIAGAGPAGLAAGIYAARAGMNALVLERLFAGGQIATATVLENYPALGPTNGADFAMKLLEHSESLGVKVEYDDITSYELKGDVKRAVGSAATYEAKSIILAMGAKSRTLGVQREQQMAGRGLSYCATCDGALYRGKDMVVVGGGDTALEESIYLSNLASKVSIVHRRDTFRGQAALQKRLLADEKITPYYDCVISALNGDTAMESVELTNVKTGEKTVVPTSVLFVAVGRLPDTMGIHDDEILNDERYILTDQDMRTAIPGVFAAGDVREKYLRQVVTAMADGAIAASRAAEYVLNQCPVG
jgi:thioredoxin reductase (NADPH)